MFKKFTVHILVFISVAAVGQKVDTNLIAFRQAEYQLKDIQWAAFTGKIEAERIEANKKIIGIWDGIVSDARIMQYNFDGLKNDYAIISPKDKKFKLITWNVFKNDGTYAFFGYLLVNNNKRVKTGFLKHKTIQNYEYFKLIDRSAAIKSPESYIGTPDKWFGMLYTAIIECDGFYTLIGYDPNDKLTQRKFVDILYFKNDGSPIFGKDVFKFPKKNPKRLMFEWSSDVSMSLKYNASRGQIVYSHLAPREEGDLLVGQVQYYGPDGSFDALELKKDRWVLVEDVDINSGIDAFKESKKPNPRKQTPVYKPK